MLGRGLGFGAVVLALAQLVRPQLTNPPVKSEISAPPAVQTVLRKACYDCHSNQTVWPWYSQVVPVSWLLAHDVTEGREELNFSTWNDYTPEQRAKHLAQTVHELEEGEMPPLTYRLMHPEARLSAGEIASLQQWAESGGSDAAR